MEEGRDTSAAKLKSDQSMSAVEDHGNPSSSSGKIKIKLKMKEKIEPETETETEKLQLSNQEKEKEEKEKEEEENKDVIPSRSVVEDGDGSNSKGNRVCQYCNKVFTCGKALGGHIRIHIQANKKLKQQQQQKQDLYEKKVNKPAAVELRKRAPSPGDYSVAPPAAASAGEEEKQVCCLCGKEFPSRKSLFGHMRCHPERDWRGIQPPKNSETSSTLSDSVVPDQKADDDYYLTDDSVESVDLRQPVLPKWGVKGVRGKCGVAASDNGDSDDFEMRQAVRLLLLIARSGQENSGPSSKARVEGFDADYNNRSLMVSGGSNESARAGVLRKRKHPSAEGSSEGENVGGVVAKKRLDKGKGKLIDVDDHYNNYTDQEDDDDDDDDKDENRKKTRSVGIKINSESSGKSRKQKKRKLRDLEKDGSRNVENSDPMAATARHRCNICHKTFSSYQALGGHVSSHNKNFNRLSIPAAATEDALLHTAAATGDQEETEQQHPKQPAAANSSDVSKEEMINMPQHQCEICGKVFPTGQALGGHKRSHTTSINSVEGSSSQVLSNGEGSSTQVNNNRILLGFDLNEPPPVEDEVRSQSATTDEVTEHAPAPAPAAAPAAAADHQE